MKITSLVKSILLLIVSITFVNCSAKFRLSKDRIKGYWPMENGFELSKLMVFKVDSSKGVPVEYIEKQKVLCLLSSRDFNTLDSSEVSMILNNTGDLKKDGSKKGIKSVFFWKENDNVRWIKAPGTSNDLVQTLPFKFEPLTWYKINNLYPASYAMEYKIYFYINEKSELKDFHSLEIPVY